MADSQVNEQFRHSDFTKGIIGVFYDVYNELGHGFLESVYENSLALALRERAWRFTSRSQFLFGFADDRLAISTPTFW